MLYSALFKWVQDVSAVLLNNSHRGVDTPNLMGSIPGTFERQRYSKETYSSCVTGLIESHGCKRGRLSYDIPSKQVLDMPFA